MNSERFHACRVCGCSTTLDVKAAHLTLATQDTSLALAWMICGKCWKKYGSGIAFAVSDSIDEAMRCEAVEQEVRETEDAPPSSQHGAYQ